MADNYKTHRLGSEDTLVTLATRYLGTGTRWREIATLNHLRAPYVSALPLEWFGPHLAVGLLDAGVDTDATTVTLLGERAVIFEQGSIFFLDGYDSAGTYIYDAVPVDSYAEDTGLLTVFEPLRHAWRAGTRWHLFPPQQSLGARVARPGDVVLLPIIAGNSGQLLPTTQDLIALYGVDIRLDRDGQLAYSRNDLALVRGMDNAAQALRFRVDLPFGTALLHPDEGCRVHDLIGRRSAVGLLMQARAYVREAVERDVRVVGVDDVRAATDGQGDAVRIDARVQLANSPEQVRIDALIRGT